MPFDALLAQPATWVCVNAAYGLYVLHSRLRCRRRLRTANRGGLPAWAHRRLR